MKDSPLVSAGLTLRALASLSVGGLQLLVGKDDGGRDLRVADIDFDLKLAALFHPRGDSDEIPPTPKLQVGYLESFACPCNGPCGR
jgi:hypothetical protein